MRISIDGLIFIHRLDIDLERGNLSNRTYVCTSSPAPTVCLYDVRVCMHVPYNRTSWYVWYGVGSKLSTYPRALPTIPWYNPPKSARLRNARARDT